MKKYIIYLLCFLITIFSGIIYTYATSYRVSTKCHSFLWKEFHGTVKSSGTDDGSFRIRGGGRTMHNDCTEANIAYQDFLKTVYRFLYIFLVLLSGLGYSIYRRYRAKKLIVQSSIDS